MQGVLPIGPNGVSVFDSLARSPLSNAEVSAGMISYDYTLNQQGLNSNVSCHHTPTNLFNFSTPDNSNGSVIYVVTYNANCAFLGELDTLTNVTNFIAALSNSTLVYWACQSAIPTASYTIYLSGLFGYANTVGNIICAVNPIQSAIYSVLYRSTEGIFSATEMNASTPITFSTLINNALVGLGGLIADSQNFESNLVAETILEFGLRSFGPSADPGLQVAQYLRICEQMIQGIIEYEVCPVNFFIPYLSLIAYHLTDYLPSVDLFDTSQYPFLLQAHGDWETEI